MRIKDPLAEGEEPFNLVPLTDMVFNLLIFFMCATTFAQVEKDLAVQLPHVSTAFTPLSAPPKVLTINIEKDGKMVVAGKTYDDKGLASLVGGAVRNAPATAVMLRADEQTIMRHFARVAGLCRAAGVQEAKVVYVDDPARPAP